MAYRVIISSPAQKEIRSLRNNTMLGRLRAAIRNLSEDPRPAGARKLSGSELWRIRVGVFRIVYEIDDEIVTVRIVRVRHRADAYRN